MKVILTSSVDKLGNAGDIKNVSEGFARNYLIPKGLVLPATDANMAKITSMMGQLKGKKEIEIKRIKDFVDKINKTSVNIFVEVGEAGKMFGSVSKEEIAQAITRDTGIEIDKRDILAEDAIRETGVYALDVKMNSESFPAEASKVAKVKVWIIAKEKEEK